MISDKAYFRLHARLRKKYGKSRLCEKCGKHGKTHYANISGSYKYLRSDYMKLCPRCHKRYDLYGEHGNLKDYLLDLLSRQQSI